LSPILKQEKDGTSQALSPLFQAKLNLRNSIFCPPSPLFLFIAQELIIYKRNQIRQISDVYFIKKEE